MVDESHKKDGGSGRSGKSRKEAIVRSEEQIRPKVCTEFFQNADFGEADPTRFNIDIDLASLAEFGLVDRRGLHAGDAAQVADEVLRPVEQFTTLESRRLSDSVDGFE